MADLIEIRNPKLPKESVAPDGGLARVTREAFEQPGGWKELGWVEATATAIKKEG